MNEKKVKSWRGMGRMASALLLLVYAGCSENEHAKSAPFQALPTIVSLDAGHGPSTFSQGDAGVTASLSPGDAGSMANSATANSPDGATARPLMRVPALKLQSVASEESFIRAHAKDEGWDTGTDRLKSYWHPASRVEDGSLGKFTLGYLSNPDEPRGGKLNWMLLRQQGENLAVYGPLITQQPWTPNYMHKVKPSQMEFRTIQGYPGKLLWIQMQDKLTTPLDLAGERLESKTRLLGYGFLVNAQGGFTPVSFQLPEKVTHEINDETTAETSLVVSFPSADRMKVAAGPAGVDAEQQVWVGEHSIGK